MSYNEEISLGTDPNNADTDGDLLVDGFEAQYFNYDGSGRLSPLTPDDPYANYDGDALINLAESFSPDLNPFVDESGGFGLNSFQAGGLVCERRPKSAAPAGLKVWRPGASYTGPNVGPVWELLA